MDLTPVLGFASLYHQTCVLAVEVLYKRACFA